MEITSRTSSGALGAPSAPSTDSALGPDAFLRLLVTQIRNQDPMQPMDTEGMMQQLAQLTSVERLVAIDDRLATLSLATAGMANSQAADLVGRTVEADTSHVVLGEGESVTGAFHLDAPAATTEIAIYDGAGRLVRTIDAGAQAAGNRTFTWDGRMDDGSSAPSGRYRVAITARNADGAAVNAEMTVQGIVDAVRYDGGYPLLDVDGASVMMGDVRSIGGGP